MLAIVVMTLEYVMKTMFEADWETIYSKFSVAAYPWTFLDRG